MNMSSLSKPLQAFVQILMVGNTAVIIAKFKVHKTEDWTD